MNELQGAKWINAKTKGGQKFVTRNVLPMHKCIVTISMKFRVTDDTFFLASYFEQNLNCAQKVAAQNIRPRLLWEHHASPPRDKNRQSGWTADAERRGLGPVRDRGPR